ncbi:MAG: TldD/PmbA family protein, partial [Gaiellaceae bacterium]
VELAPLAAETGEYRAPVEQDPIEVPLERKIELCLRAEEGLRRPEVKITEASVRALRELRVFASSEGARIRQELVECGGGIDALAVGDDGRVQARSYPSAHGGSSGQAGWEYVEGLGLEQEAPRVAEEAAALLTADPCPATVTTVVLDAEQMELQVHESVGHPTELDRVYGTEAAYAGTSFLKPEDLGSLRYGSEHMNITADPTTPLGLGTFGYDDEGVPARRQPVVEAGVLRGYLSSRQTAALIGEGQGGSMRADSWRRMPLVRMTNLHLEPGEGSFDDLLADVEDGIYLCTNKSWSIDDKRLNFQFGTQIAWEIKRGKLGRMLRDATYMGVTPEFWAGLDAVAGKDEWRLFGLTNCGKGQPGQHAHVSHGTSPARFRDVQVGVRQ